MQKRKILPETRVHAEVDCADCPGARRCWDEPLPSRSEVIVRRQNALDKGAKLFTQGEPFASIYVMVSGCLSLRETMPDGTERIVGFRVPGEIVGLEGWTRGQYPYTAEAAETTMMCRLAWPRSAGRSGSHALVERLLAKTVTQLAQASTPWPGLPATERVAAFVEDFARRSLASSASRDRIDLPMTRAQLGSYLGLAEETVVRALAQLHASKRLDIRGRSVALGPGVPTAETP